MTIMKTESEMENLFVLRESTRKKKLLREKKSFYFLKKAQNRLAIKK